MFCREASQSTVRGSLPLAPGSLRPAFHCAAPRRPPTVVTSRRLFPGFQCHVSEKGRCRQGAKYKQCHLHRRCSSPRGTHCPAVKCSHRGFECSGTPDSRANSTVPATGADSPRVAAGRRERDGSSSRLEHSATLRVVWAIPCARRRQNDTRATGRSEARCTHSVALRTYVTVLSAHAAVPTTTPP